MKIQLSKNNGLGGIEVTQEETKTVFNYGTRHQHSDLTTHIELEGFPDGYIVNPTCGCTTATGNKNTYTIKYDAKNLGQFGKVLKVTTNKGTLLHTITLRGTIIR